MYCSACTDVLDGKEVTRTERMFMENWQRQKNRNRNAKRRVQTAPTQARGKAARNPLGGMADGHAQRPSGAHNANQRAGGAPRPGTVAVGSSPHWKSAKAKSRSGARGEARQAANRGRVQASNAVVTSSASGMAQRATGGSAAVPMRVRYRPPGSEMPLLDSENAPTNYTHNTAMGAAAEDLSDARLFTDMTNAQSSTVDRALSKSRSGSGSGGGASGGGENDGGTAIYC